MKHATYSLENIRKQTRLGKPLGDDKFIDKLSEKLGRNLVFRPKDRPKKEDFN